MKKFLVILLSLVLCSLSLSCGSNSKAQEVKIMDSVKISINGQNFSARLEDNASARAFAEKLPLEVEMQELNGNEKYFYLDSDLPSDSERVKQIHAGDLMLFGSNCVVIFYKDFATSYSYTRLGKIDNAADLSKVLGGGNVHVKFGR